MSLMDFLAGGTATVRASVTLNGLPLRPDVESKLVRTVVDSHLHLPDMFELTFLDEECTLASTAGIDIGGQVEIGGGAPDSAEGAVLIKGEITSVEAVCAQLHVHTVVRGYCLSHRLQGARRTRTFLQMKDSDIARQVASEAGLTAGPVDDTRTVHEHLGQVAQTDWAFLTQRARELGYELGMADGQFFFRKPSGRPAGGAGGLAGAAAGAAASAGLPVPGGPPTLTFKENLLEFFPRVTAANLTPKVEVRVWDPKAASAVSAKADVITGTATISGQDPAGVLTRLHSRSPLPGLPALPSLPSLPGMPNFGQAPDGTAHVAAGYPLAEGTNATAAAEEMAAGLSEHVGSAFAEAEGHAVGHPGIAAGKQVTIAGVPAHFAGTWTVTNAKHVFDEHEGGYHVRFYVSGRHERSLLGLASVGGTQTAMPTIPGLVCGVVTNVNDPTGKGRVKVALPWLSPQYETGWARVVQFGAGKASGGMFLPEVSSEVLLGFEHGDPRRPYVLGGLLNDNTEYLSAAGPPTKTSGQAASVVKRGIATPTENGLVFTDELMPAPPQPGGRPTKSEVVLGTLDGSVALSIDRVGGTVVLKCDPAPAPGGATSGTLRIECGNAGNVEIKTGAGGSVSVDGGNELSLKAATSIKIESQGTVEIKGTQIKLN
ncbi:MAG TPA: phage baseplate assembly protein V [Pseudonocardiaceae bacterium]